MSCYFVSQLLAMLFLVFIVGVLAVANTIEIPVPSKRILGGVDTSIERHPYQVSIERNGELICGGSIYTKTHIVTAAHCIFGNFSKPLTVRVGSTYREKGGTVYEAVRLVPHPLFGWDTMDNDVGVVVLNASITFGTTKQPIKLVDEEPRHGEMLTVTGWGYTFNHEKAEVLQLLRVSLIRRDICVKVLKMVTEKFICAGGGNDKGIAQADSGSPLVNKNGELVGMVSFSHVSWRRGYPGAFSNVANRAMRKFIDDTVFSL